MPQSWSTYPAQRLTDEKNKQIEKTKINVFVNLQVIPNFCKMPKIDIKNVKDVDLYLLLELESDATEKEITKAYRKKALKCHPDKNPDNPKAAELFHQLSEALAVLTDEEARKAYDNLLKAKKANELRNRQLDAKRKKLKDELEAREKAASYNMKDETVLAGERLAAEIERLQKEGKRQLEEEQERLKEMVRTEPTYTNYSSNYQVKQTPAKLKVRWKDVSNGTKYDKDNLRTIFCKYGDIGEIIVLESKKKSGSHSGLIEMKTLEAAKMAVSIERGFLDNPLKVKLLGDKDDNEPDQAVPPSNSFQPSVNQFQNNVSNFNDYETLVMRQLRQEEERKRLIEEMKRQDAEDA